MGVIVAIDGPAGAGKSTVAARLAERLGFFRLDTGAIYRSVALLAQRRGVAWDDEAGLGGIAADLEIAFDGGRIVAGGEDVTDAIRTPEMSRGASSVAGRPAVRAALLPLQRRIARAAPVGCVLEGRDIGTVVFPDADVKFWLDAGERSRAERRWKELRARGDDVTVEEVLADQRRRDREDAERAIAPLKPAADAEALDTTSLTLEQVVDALEARVRERLG